MATAMSLPTGVFAAEDVKNVYDENSSVMGILENQDKTLEIRTEEDNSRKLESTNYTMEIAARILALDKLVYDVKIIKNNKENTSNQDLALNFTANPNSSINKLKVLSAKASTESGLENIEIEENTRKADLDSLKLKLADQDEIFLEIGADLRDVIDTRTYDMLVSLFDGDEKKSLSYNLIANEKKDEDSLTEDGKDIEKISLSLNEDDPKNLKGEFESNDLLGLLSTKSNIVWTDYLLNESEDKKKISYDFKLDDKQDTKDTKINIDYYENTSDGYIFKKDFSQSVDFSEKIDFEIPADFVAKLSLKTRVDKKDTGVKNYSLNNRELQNPSYKEKEENKSDDDEDLTSANVDKSKENQDSKKEESQIAKEKETENKSKDLNKLKSFLEEEETISAISLNKDSLLSKLETEENLTEDTKKAIEKLASDLESYNQEKITDQELKDFTKALATNNSIEKKDLRNYLESIISGINKESNKVANLNIDEIIKYAYPEKADEKSAEKTEEKSPEDLSPDALAAKKLAEEGITIEDFQKYMYELEEKYSLTDEDAARIYDKNAESIKALAQKSQDEKTKADVFAVNNNFADKKFTIIAPITLSTITGPIQTSQKITLNLDEKLTVKDGTTIAPLKNDSGTVIARGVYDRASNSIIYTFTAPVREKTTVTLNQEVDFNTEKIGDATEITVKNSISAPGMAKAKNFPEVTVKDTDSNPSSKTEIDSGDMELEFITEIEYFTETLTRSTNEGKLFEIVKNNFNSDLSNQQIRSDYVGWKINIPGVDVSGMDIREIKKEKYDYNNLNFSLYAPAGQSLEDYKVVVEDGEGGRTSYSGSMTKQVGEHYIYNFSIPKAQLTEKGYIIYVVAKAPKKRQNYAVGLKVEPDKNYVVSILKKFEDKFEEFAKGNPFIYKWKDTTDANPYANGIELLDTRMVYIEPNGWQDLFPYNEFKSIDYNDNIDDTDIMKNTVSMFGNIDENGNITWTISETFPAEKLENKNTVGIDAYSAKSDSGNLGNPSVQILVPNNAGGYDAKKLGKIDNARLQNEIGNRPGTIVNYTFTDKAANKEEFTTLKLDSGKTASIAYKPSLLQREEGAEKDTTGLAYLHKVQEHKDGPGYEIALAGDQAHTLTAFIPSNPSANPRYKDPAFKDTGVVVFCLNPGKPEPTRQYKFNGTITKGEWSTAEKDWAKNGKALAALATASEAKSSPLYKGNANDEFYASLYEHILRMYWYGQEMAEEYQLDQQSYYKMIQYNVYYWLAGGIYAENFRNGGGYNPNYFSSAEYSYTRELIQRIKTGKDWESVDYNEEIQFFYYGHDKSRSYQNTITGDTKKKAKKEGSVTVNKIDQDGKKLAGAAFQLLGEDKKTVIKTLVTDANGVAIFDHLDYGTYYIKEVQAPKGYQFREELSKVEVGENQAHVTFNATNTKNEIEFRKVNENGYAMAGVVFELRQNGRPIGEQTSDKNGKFSWKELTPGYYEVVEKDISKYPKYSENQGRVVASFRVDENNKIQDKVINYPNGSSKTDIKNEKNEGKPIGVEFTKVDLNKNPLEGAEFVLEYRKPGSSIFRELAGSRRRSNSEGKLVWYDLVDGDYRVIETKAPDGNYDTDLNLGEKATFTIEKNQNGYYEIKSVTPENKEITNKEKPEEPKEYFGEFEFTKVDSEDKKALQGVEFTLTSDAPVGPEKDKFDYKVSKTTDAEGKIEYTKLYPGTYTLKETKQLPGYQENTKTYKVVVANDGKTTIPDLENNKYELVFTNNDTTLRDTRYAYIKETLEQNPNKSEGMIYKITIKPKRELYQVKFGYDSWGKFDSYSLNQGAYIRKSQLPAVNEEKTFKYYISIKDIDSFTKNVATSPINNLVINEGTDEFGDAESFGSNPKVTLKSDSESSGLTITNDKEKPEPAHLTIKKVDSETNEGLEGAKFRLYYTEANAKDDEFYLQEVTTNEHGYAIFDSAEIMPNTTYYVKEIAAPEGYKITSEITEVKSSASEDNTINAEIPNDKNNARFELYKKGSDGAYLAGVKFKLTNKTTNNSVVLETDGNGYIFYDKLKPNTRYELEEIESAKGYTLNNAKATISVNASGEVTVNTNGLAKAKEGENQGLVLVATNIKQPSIDFVKQDEASKNPLYGGEFVLYKDGEKVTNSLTSSDKEGKFGFDNLEDGSYTVYETASPDGYPYLEEKLKVATFTVKDGQIIDLKTNQKFGESSIENFDPNEAYPIYNKINEIKFTKIGKDKEALAGAKFKLDRVWDSYDDNGKLQPNRETVLDNIETLDDGIIALSATKAGRYQLIETQAPDGYKQIKTNNTAGGLIVAEFTVERISLDIKNVLVGNKYIQDMNEYTGDLEIVNKKDVKGKFQVKKVQKGESSGFVYTFPLEGAKFLLKDMESGQYVKTDGTFTTNSGNALTKGDATVNYENLPVGKFELREFEAPDGYVRTINTWKIEVNDDGTTAITPKEKYDEGVEADITNETTGSQASLRLVNKSNEIEFTKIDSKTEKPLAGVEFEVWWDQQGNKTSDNDVYKKYIKISQNGSTTFRTDENGKFKLKNLGTGHYKIYEVKVPDGYKINDKPVDNEPIAGAKGEFVNEFFVDIDGDIKKNDKGIVGGDDDVLVTKIKNTPITAKFRVQKVGEDGVEKLSGADFKLYKLNEEGKADKTNPISPTPVKDAEDNTITGLIEFADLADGEYLLEETKAPDGYSLSKAKWNVSIKEGKVNIQATDGSASFTRTDDTLTLNVVNKKTQGKFKLIKVDEKDNRLEGAKFKLTGVTDSDYSKEAESDTNGEIIFEELAEGEYTLEEIKPAKGHVPTNIKWNVVVDKNGNTNITAKSLFRDDVNTDPSKIEDLSNNQEKLNELNNKGYLIANVTTNIGDGTDGNNISTIKVVNKKAVYPMTGGPGVWIGFTVLGLILMFLAGFYYNMKKKYG